MEPKVKEKMQKALLKLEANLNSALKSASELNARATETIKGLKKAKEEGMTLAPLLRAGARWDPRGVPEKG